MPELAGEGENLLREVIPKLSRVASWPMEGIRHKLSVQEAQRAAGRFGVKFQPVVITAPEEIESAFSAIIKERAGALTVQPLFVTVLDRARGSRSSR